MRFPAASAGSCPRIGDKPDLQILRKTIDLREKKKRDDKDLAGAQDAMTKAAIDDQLKAWRNRAGCSCRDPRRFGRGSAS